MYKVKIAKFESVEKNEFTHRYNYDENSIDNIMAIKYKDYFVDIENGNIYPELKRNENKTLAKQNIVINKMYAIESCKVDEFNLMDAMLAIKTKLLIKLKK